MANKIKPRRSYTASSVPLSSDLDTHELAINWVDGKAFTKDASGNIVSVTLGGGSYTLPTASSSTLGGVRVGSGLAISSGVLSASDSRWDLFLPPAPTGVTGTFGNAQVSLTWTAPTGVLAQTPITDYTVQYSSNSGSSWTTFSRSASTTTSATVTGLTNGTAYTFQVATVSGIGTGSYSTASSSVTPNNFTATAVLLTSGTSYTVPSGATTMKAWAVGAGGGASDGGGAGAGGVAYKTFSVSGGQSISYAVGSGGTSSGSPSAGGDTTVSVSGSTITGSGGKTGGPAGAGAAGGGYSGGDGGASGGAGSGTYSNPARGGAVGGNAASLATCSRRPMTNVSGLVAALQLAGISTTESCSSDVSIAAFGSSSFMNDGAPPYYYAGRGGGGAGWDSVTRNGGGGAVVLYFT